eukprot:6270098-Amphidinium_carterae.1
MHSVQLRGVFHWSVPPVLRCLNVSWTIIIIIMSMKMKSCFLQSRRANSEDDVTCATWGRFGAPNRVLGDTQAAGNQACY